MGRLKSVILLSQPELLIHESFELFLGPCPRRGYLRVVFRRSETAGVGKQSMGRYRIQAWEPSSGTFRPWERQRDYQWKSMAVNVSHTILIATP